MTAIDHAGWTGLTGVPPELVALAERCFTADGGLPLAVERGFLAGRWTGRGVVAFAHRDGDGRLIAAGAARPARGGASFTGLVDPAHRGRGIGSLLLDRGLAEARTLAHAPAPSVGALAGGALAGGAERLITVETESLTEDAEALFRSRGLRRAFAEDVMRIDLAAAAPAVRWPAGTTTVSWSAEVSRRFHAVYDAAFRERPGFPGDPADVWIADHEDDEDFLPDCSLLATLPAVGDAGFVVAARDWIVQVGVVPAARRLGLGSALVSEALTRLRARGSDHAWLTVNLNNPGAAAAYRRLGFEHRGQRARYQALL